MSDAIAKIAERRIREAIQRGDLRNLPGAGRPLPRAPLASMPKAAHEARLLQFAGGLPPEVALLKRIETLEEKRRLGSATASHVAELRDCALRLSILAEQHERYTLRRRAEAMLARLAR